MMTILKSSNEVEKLKKRKLHFLVAKNETRRLDRLEQEDEFRQTHYSYNHQLSNYRFNSNSNPIINTNLNSKQNFIKPPSQYDGVFRDIINPISKSFQ